MSTAYVGLDAHSTTSTTVVLNEEKEVIDEKVQFRTCKEDLVKALDVPADKILVHLEGTDIFRDVYDLIEDHVEDVIVSDPRQNDLIGKTAENDRDAAYKLARLLRMKEYNQVYYDGNQQMRMFQSMVRDYIRINKDQVRLKQQIQALLREYGVHRTGSISLSTKDNWKRILDRTQQKPVKQILRGRFDQLKTILTGRDRIWKRVLQMGREFPVIDRFVQIPGCREYCGSVFVAYVKNPFRFKKRQQLWKYAKIAVKTKDSNGKPMRRKKLNPAGHGQLKNVLRKIFEGATSCKETNGIQRFFQASLQETGDYDHSRLTTMRKICDVMWSMWKHSTEYDDDRLTHPNGS